MENIDKAAEMSFHGIDYIIKISTRDDVLYIEIEQKDNGNIWKNSFTANYIEEISQKTGNFKKFPVFVKMLLSSIVKTSDAVFLDILTYQDLEMLKARKQKTNTSMTTNPEKMKNNKRYMILTYSVEYDKVHYPLPLNFEENPDVEALKNTIRRLRLEMDEMKTTQVKTTQSGEGFFMTQEGEAHKNPDLVLLKVENETLKEKIKKLEDNSLNTTKKMGAVQHDLELKSKLEVETELETLKKDYVRDIKRMKAKLEETEIQLEKTKEELSRAGTGSNGLDGSGRKLTKDEEIEFAHSKKMAAKYQAENEKLNQELEDFKNLDRKQKARIKQLETELESALKRATYSRGSNQSGGSPYSRSRGNSPGNSATKRYTSTPTNYSPGFKAAENKKTTPVRGRTGITTPSPKGTPKGTPTRSTGSATRTYQYGGTSRDRNSPLNKNATAPNPLNKRTTPQRTNVTTNTRDYGSNKRSPQPMRNLSPSNTKPNTYSPSGSKLSPGNRFGMRVNNYVSGGNLQRKDLENSLRNRSKNSNNADSGDEMGRPRRELSNKGQSLNSILSSNRNNNVASSYNNNINNIQQKLKENIHDFKESKNSKVEKPVQNAPDASTEITDIGDRLNKLQDLLKRAKS